MEHVFKATSYWLSLINNRRLEFCAKVQKCVPKAMSTLICFCLEMHLFFLHFGLLSTLRWKTGLFEKTLCGGAWSAVPWGRTCVASAIRVVGVYGGKEYARPGPAGGRNLQQDQDQGGPAIFPDQLWVRERRQDKEEKKKSGRDEK